MSRVEDNRIVVNEMTKRAEQKPIGTYSDMVTFQLGAIASMLTDISKSFAVLADKVESYVNSVLCEEVNNG